MDFGTLANDWWNPDGPMRPLHALNPQRIAYIRQQIGDVAGKAILDIGCGGGIVSEPLARLGATVTGIDLSPDLIAIASSHAAQSGLTIDYRAGRIEDETGQYDVVLALEIVEHLHDPARFVAECARRLKPGGTMILSTLNRTVKSMVLGKYAAEYILRWVPPGTHDWDMFIKPSELVAHCEAAGLKPADLCGLKYNPVRSEFALDKSDLSINYFLTCTKERP